MGAAWYRAMVSGAYTRRVAQQSPFQSASALEQTGQFQRARAMYRQLSGRFPRSAAVFAGIGRCSMAIHEYADAQRALASAVRIEPRNPDHRTNLAYCLLSMGLIEEGRAEAREALALRPGHPFALRCLAETHRISGDARGAYDVIAPTIKSSRDDPLMVIYFARLAAGIGRHDEAAQILSSLDDAGGLPGPVRAALHYELAAVLDRLERYDDAWASIDLANRLSPSSYSIPALSAHVDALIRVWTPQRVASMPRASKSSDLPIYIVGMPRSGSSLLEQVLSGCVEIAPGGERADIPLAARDLLYPEGGLHADADLLARRADAVRPSSLDRLAAQIAGNLAKVDPGARRVTDKHLVNFLYVPVIRMLFPAAPIIHTRRHPLDTCLSCYFQNFTTGMEFTNDLATLGAYYNQYARIMRHWAEVFPGELLELNYEDLVDDLETQARRVIAAIGLPWNDACLRFHERRNAVATMSAEQVRKPIYTSSVGRWTRYERHLAPLRSALEGV